MVKAELQFGFKLQVMMKDLFTYSLLSLLVPCYSICKPLEVIPVGGNFIYEHIEHIPF